MLDQSVETLDYGCSYGGHQDQPAQNEEGIIGSLQVPPLTNGVWQLVEGFCVSSGRGNQRMYRGHKQNGGPRDRCTAISQRPKSTDTG